MGGGGCIICPPGGENLNLFEKEIEQKSPSLTRRGLQPPRWRVKEIFFFYLKGGHRPPTPPGGAFGSAFRGGSSAHPGREAFSGGKAFRLSFLSVTTMVGSV